MLTAITLAQQQKARSFELCAALSLAKLYQSNGRPADAHAVLAPALEGFSPTPELPEIDAQAGSSPRSPRPMRSRTPPRHVSAGLKLQTDYGQGLLWSRGFGSEEAKAALDRAQELAVGTNSAPPRFPTYYGK